jgi:hypothetical protein
LEELEAEIEAQEPKVEPIALTVEECLAKGLLETFDRKEQEKTLKVLDRFEGNVLGTAEALHIHRPKVYAAAAFESPQLLPFPYQLRPADQRDRLMVVHWSTLAREVPVFVGR